MSDEPKPNTSSAKENTENKDFDEKSEQSPQINEPKANNSSKSTQEAAENKDTEKSEQSPQNRDTEESDPVNPLQELIKNRTAKSEAERINELCQEQSTQKIIQNYIFNDRRSGGIYLENGINNITGDLIGRNQTKSTTLHYHKQVTAKILSKDIEKVRSIYLETSSYIQAKSILNENHILVLHGDPHLDKHTTAIYLLSLLNPQEIFVIDRALADLSSFHCETKQVYLLDRLPVDAASKLSIYLLNGFSEQLKEQQSHLVITIDSSVQILQESLGRYGLHWNELPNPDRLLEKHLEWHFQDRDREMLVRAYGLAQSDSVREILDNKQLSGDIDNLASLLTNVVTENLNLDEELSRYFRFRVERQVKSWFEEEQDIAQRIFMIALAILSGSNYQAIVDTSEHLHFLIKQGSQEEELSDSEVLFSTTRSQRLKGVFAHLVQGYENTSELGRTPVELIEFDNPKFQHAVLSHVWHEYDRLREPLFECLRRLGSNPNFEVRIRTAMAVGEISKYAFRDIVDKILRPWATSDDSRLQQLVALALSVPVFESNLAPQVVRLLHEWSDLENSLNLLATATTAYGGYVGLRFPEIALPKLFAIAESGEVSLFSAVVESVISLFETGKLVSDQYFNVLNALQEWTEQPKRSLVNQLGLLIFWELMDRTIILKNYDNDSVPTLLWLAKESPVYEDIIICLLRRTLNHKQTRTHVLDKIHDWLKLADYNPRLYKVLGRIIYTLINQGNSRERERILYKLKQWASFAQSKESNTASKILSVINKSLKIYPT